MALDNVTEGVIITGCCSSLGRNLADQMSSRFRIFALDAAAPHESATKSVRYSALDLSSESSIKKTVRKVTQSGLPLRAWIHLTGHPAIGVNIAPEDLISGSELFLQTLQDEGIPLKQVIYLSSANIYAPFDPGTRVNEEWPIEAEKGFAEVARQVEQRLIANREEAAVLAMRAGEIYGEAYVGEKLGRVMAQCLEGKQAAAAPDYGQDPLFIHDEDAIRALIGAIDHVERIPEVASLIVAEPESPRLAFLEREVKWCLSSMQFPTAFEAKEMQEPISIPEEPSDHFEVDISRARDWLGWQPHHRLVEEIPGFVEKAQKGRLLFEHDRRVSQRPYTPRSRRPSGQAPKGEKGGPLG